MIYFSSLLKTDPTYKPAAKRLFATLTSHGVDFCLLDGSRDIWLRDFMPVQTRSGKCISFRYEPSYLEKDPNLKTNFRQDISEQFSVKISSIPISILMEETWCFHLQKQKQ